MYNWDIWLFACYVLVAGYTLHVKSVGRESRGYGVSNAIRYAACGC